VRTKVTLVLVFLNVALFFFIFKFDRHWRTEADSLELRRRVLGPESTDIRSLELKGPGDAPIPIYALARTRDQWFLTRPFSWPANPNAVRTIIQELQLLEHEASFSVADLRKTNQSLADFGLEHPKLTLEFTSGEAAAAPRTVLRIGDTTNVGNRLYLLSNDGERVHVVNRALLDALSLTAEQLRSDALLTIPVFEARSLSIQGGATSATSAGLRVRISREGTRWKFDTIVKARANKDLVDLTINLLDALHPRKFNPTPEPATKPASAPTLRLSIEGNNRQETLYLGDPVPNGQKTADGQPATEYFAQLEDRKVLFTLVVPNTLVDTLRNANVTLRDRRLLDFDKAAVAAVTIRAPIMPNQPAVTLQRLENPAGGTEGGTWQVVRRAEGSQGPQTSLAADTVTVQRLLTQLSILSAKENGFVEDAPSARQIEDWGFNRPAREVTVALSGNAPAMVLRLGTDSAGAVFARVGDATDAGSSIYAVPPDILRELRPDPIAWRDRTIYDLPAAVRISSLKLTDLESKAALLDVTFDPTGHATGTNPKPDALSKFLPVVHRLHASEFVRDGFAETFTVGGAERAWRFRLDLVAALPGGAAGEQPRTLTLFIAERTGGSQQLAGSTDTGSIFALEQSWIDALWPLTEGAQDPGPPVDTKK
jgi:hypothetical protein